VKFRFYPSKLKKQLFFANNFKIRGEAWPPLPTPMDATVFHLTARHALPGNGQTGFCFNYEKKFPIFKDT